MENSRFNSNQLGQKYFSGLIKSSKNGRPEFLTPPPTKSCPKMSCFWWPPPSSLSRGRLLWTAPRASVRFRVGFRVRLMFRVRVSSCFARCSITKISSLLLLLPRHETPLPQRPSSANSYYHPLAVRVHTPVPASCVLHEEMISVRT